MWMTQTTMHHQPQDVTYLQKTWNIIKMITLFKIITPHSHRCFHFIYICHYNLFPNMFFIPQHLRIYQHLTQYQHGNGRILANGMGISHLEHSHCFTPVLGRRSRPSYPRRSFWTCILSFLLDPNQPHLMPAAQRNLIWMLCSGIECSFYTAIIPGRWGYESGSNEDVPTPLHKMPHIHHVSSLEHASFNPIHSTPHRPVTCNPTHSPARSVQHHLSFNDDSMDTSTSSSTTSPESSDMEEEDFQTVPLDDEPTLIKLWFCLNTQLPWYALLSNNNLI